MDLFVYGVLLEDDYLLRLIGRIPDKKKNAILHCFKRLGKSIIIPTGDRDNFVLGEILEGLEPNEIARLDRYEGHPDCWKRTGVIVSVDDKPYEVEAYIPTRDTLAAGSWGEHTIWDNQDAYPNG